MTFDARERSLFGGRPVALLELKRGALIERYTDADRLIAIDGQDYTPLAMSRSEISDTGERGKNQLSITLPKDAPCRSWWFPHPRSASVEVRWKTFHYGDADPEVATQWVGRVVSPEFTDSTMVLRCEQSSTTARTRGNALCWMRGCPHAVYSEGCGLDPADFAIPFEITTVDGDLAVATEFGTAPLSLAGGFIEIVADDGELESRSILEQDGTQVRLNYGAEDLGPGTEGTAYPGCPGDWEACDARGNTDNYGGNPYMPNKNPFSGNPR